MSDVFQALSSPVRRQILNILKRQDCSAGEIAEQINVAKSTLSGHFNVLKNANLVVTVKQGTTITYSLNTSVLEDVMTSLMDLLDTSDSGKNKEHL